jgi:hypothetical protein
VNTQIPIILKNDKKCYTSPEKLDWQIANGAVLLGYYKHLSWEDCLKRYPRIVEAMSRSYYTQQEVAYLLRDIRWFRQVDPEKHSKLYEVFRIHLNISRNLTSYLRAENSHIKFKKKAISIPLNGVTIASVHQNVAIAQKGDSSFYNVIHIPSGLILLAHRGKKTAFSGARLLIANPVVKSFLDNDRLDFEANQDAIKAINFINRSL